MTSSTVTRQLLAGASHVREQVYALVDLRPADALILNSAITPLTHGLAATNLATSPEATCRELATRLRESRRVLASFRSVRNYPPSSLLPSILDELDALLGLCDPSALAPPSRAHLSLVPPLEG
jgi:hypothetical protein